MSESVEMKVEYRVRVIERFVITRHYEMTGEDGKSVSGTETRGEYENADVAWEVAHALCKAEHERIGYQLDDPRIIYPRHPGVRIQGNIGSFQP